MIFKFPRKLKKKIKKLPSWVTTKEWLEWYLFPKRIDVRAMEICITYPENPATNEQLLAWYQKYYPNDRLAHHFCKQNRHKWDKFNNHEIRH